ncbi:MAG: hypothetical protein OXF23_07260 [Candidatus Dadabacteria bacterium]|nr:hypothetical protein [Candidatus Dadabacteria bacterium]
MGRNFSKKISEKIPALENRSHYQIQEYCFEIVEEKAKSADMENKIEESAYRKGLKKQDVLDVLASELRDAIFERLKMDKNADY